MSNHPPFSHPLRVADLPAREGHSFSLEPGPEARAAIAADLGIPGVRKLRFAGRIAPLGRRDWQLTATLGATAIQECVVTLQPVTTRIDETVERIYLAEAPTLPDAEGEEVEMPADDSVEPLPEVLDLGAVMIEALALALPDYPHAEGVAPLSASFAAPGTAPLTDEDAKPFAGLKALRDKLDRPDD